MAKINFNGTEFTGDHIEFKNNILYVDGHSVADFKSDGDYIHITDSDKCNIHSDKSIVLNEKSYGSLTAKSIVLNENAYGNLTAEKIVINGTVMNGVIMNAKKIVDNR